MKPSAPARRTGGRLARLFKPAVFATCLLPMAALVGRGLADRLGANPVEAVTHSTGTWTLVLLCATLAVTPLRRITGWNALARIRRMLGLFAFFHACLHLATWAWLDQWFEPADMIADVIKRPFITVGMAAFLLLLALALTSTDAMMRRLGRRWSLLHRASYVIAVLGVLHYTWDKAGKNLLVQPMIYAGVVAVLLGWRAWRHLRGRYAGSLRSSE